jgi:hypothetical protein
MASLSNVAVGKHGGVIATSHENLRERSWQDFRTCEAIRFRDFLRGGVQ